MEQKWNPPTVVDDGDDRNNRADREDVANGWSTLHDGPDLEAPRRDGTTAHAGEPGVLSMDAGVDESLFLDGLLEDASEIGADAADTTDADGAAGGPVEGAVSASALDGVVKTGGVDAERQGGAAVDPMDVDEGEDEEDEDEEEDEEDNQVEKVCRVVGEPCGLLIRVSCG